MSIVDKSNRYIFDGLVSYHAVAYDMATDTTSEISMGCDYYAPPAWLALVVDASDAERAAYLENRKRAAFDASVLREAERTASDARMIKRGVLVVVVNGRKVARGTTGRVFWIEDGGYGRIGIHTDPNDNAPTWTYLRNCEVVDAADYVLTPGDIRAEWEAA